MLTPYSGSELIDEKLGQNISPFMVRLVNAGGIVLFFELCIPKAVANLNMHA
jgi:hypothetical protein